MSKNKSGGILFPPLSIPKARELFGTSNDIF
jgi:hypothetical protein